MDQERDQRNPAAERLGSGEVSDIWTALACLHKQYRRERWLGQRESTPDDPEGGAEHLALFNNLIATVEQCQQEYQEVTQALFERWAASDNDEQRSIGEAALSGDYTGLAL